MNKLETLAKYLNIEVSEIEQTAYNDNEFETPEGDYLVLTDSEADEVAEEYIKETLWAFNADFILNFVGVDYDNDTLQALKKMQGELCESANPIVEAMVKQGGNISYFAETATGEDGRGHFLSQYDGEEVEEGEYFIYRTN